MTRDRRSDRARGLVADALGVPKNRTDAWWGYDHRRRSALVVEVFAPLGEVKTERVLGAVDALMGLPTRAETHVFLAHRPPLGEGAEWLTAGYAIADFLPRRRHEPTYA